LVVIVELQVATHRAQLIARVRLSFLKHRFAAIPDNAGTRAPTGRCLTMVFWENGEMESCRFAFDLAR
jgi:hypothetical protein